MLSPADAAIAARDPALPGLALLLDLPALAGRLRLGPIGDAYLRYKAGTKCVLSFRAGEDDHRMALAYPPERYAMLRERPRLLTDGRVVFMDDLCVAVLPMAQDRDLRALRQLADPAPRQRLLQRVGAEGARIRLLRHNPGRRAVLRLDGPDGPLALAKVHSASGWKGKEAAARLAENLGGPAVLGADEAARLLASRWVPGRPLWREGCGLAPLAGVEAAGAALARLHGAGLRPEARIGLEEEREELAGATAALAMLVPDLGQRAEALAGRIGEALAAHDRARGTIHGDFSADQVILGPAGPVIIDWDRMAEGDTARDLGSFLARLDMQAVDGALAGGAAAAARGALLKGYAQDRPVPPGVAAQQARALMLLLPEGFRQRRADWPDRAAAILARAEALLPAAARTPFGKLVARARDAAEGGVRAAAAAGLDGPVDAALLREKPERRALIRYAVEGGPAMLGKLRAKGPDHRTPRLHEKLRAAGLDGGVPHRVGVPRALGAVEELHLWLQEEVAGVPLTHHLRPGGDTAPAARAGAALARLHASGVKAPRRWTLEDEIAVLQRSLSEASASMPGQERRIAALASRSAALAEATAPGAATGIHRDWHPDQALCDGEAVWILDLDLYAEGDPALDLGNFAAHLDELAIRRHGDSAALADHEAGFLAGYALAGGSANGPRVAALKALSLARLVGISRRMPERRPASGAILDAAERAVEAALAQARRAA